MKKIWNKTLCGLLTTALVASSALGSIPATASPATVSDNTVADAVIPESISDNTVTTEDTSSPEETKTATPELIPEPTAASYYTANGTTFTVTAANGSDITTALNETLAQAKELASPGTVYTVKIPAGSYKISKTIFLDSNITLDMYNVTLTSDPAFGSFHMLMLGKTDYTASAACAGYNGFTNVTIKGGALIASAANSFTPLRLTHATNVTMKDFTVGGGCADHLVEVAAINNLLVDKCTFKDMSASTQGGTREALQLDLAVHNSILPNIYQDGTMLKNVTIQNCTFSNVSRGIGSHSQLLNAYHENIKIVNNTFDKIEQHAIVALNYYNCEISGNKITNSGSGIIFQSCKNSASTIFTTTQNGKQAYKAAFRPDTKSVIKNNTISVKYTGHTSSVSGIELSGKKFAKATKSSADNSTVPAGDYYVGGVLVEGNNITTGGYGFILQGAKNNTIKNNTVTVSGITKKDSIGKSGKYNGIHSGQESTGNALIGNKIVSAQCNGIYFQGGSSASEITGNIITNPGKEGIVVSGDCSVEGNIADNTVTGSGEHSINIYNKGTVTGDITGNTISKSKLSGIQIKQKAVVEGDISNNVISNCTVHGIAVTNSAKVNGNISGNKITSSAKMGMRISESSKVLGDISKNTISSSKLYGIYITKKAKVSGYIDGNKIQKNELPIAIEGGASANIRKNTYKKNKLGNQATILSNMYRIKSVKKTSLSSVKAGKKKITAKWKAVGGVNGYRVEISTTPDFSTITKKIDTKSQKATFKKLKKGQTYYVRVSAYKKSGKVMFFSPCSKVKKVKVK
ncbi:MAG: right-handed parallel beta-helix repeat-containing protein [Lachnospiraceae bacterium]|nr:right-handed parallel beta-helix repeat-containing protein [Lachnospiraceae bacterium]